MTTLEAVVAVTSHVSDLDGARAIIDTLLENIKEMWGLLEETDERLFCLQAQSSSMSEVYRGVAFIRSRLRTYSSNSSRPHGLLQPKDVRDDQQ